MYNLKVGKIEGRKEWTQNYILCKYTSDVISSDSRLLYRIDHFPLVSLLSIISLIFLLRGSLVKGGSHVHFPCRDRLLLCTPWRNSRPTARSLWNMRRAERCFAGRSVRYSSPSSPGNRITSLTVFAAPSKHGTHANVNIPCAFVPPAFVVKACWHDAAVIDVRGEVPSRWPQKLISKVVGVSNTTANRFQISPSSK